MTTQPVNEREPRETDNSCGKTQHDALLKLKARADLLGKNSDISFDDEFFSMLKALPSPTHTPEWAKTALQLLRDHAFARGEQVAEKSIVETRFDVELSGDWLKNGDRDDVGYVWKALSTIEPRNILDRSDLRSITFRLGAPQSEFNPVLREITIASGALGSEEEVIPIIRHELGHAVHAKFEKCIEKWLDEEFGWRTYASDDPGIDSWIETSGGWGISSDSERADICNALRKALSGPAEASKEPTVEPPDFPDNHRWNRDNFAPGIAVRNFRTAPSDNYDAWPGHGEYRIALNYWNAEFMSVNEKTFQFVKHFLNDYAMASPYEFFAELYALYHDPQNPLQQQLPLSVRNAFSSGLNGCTPPL